MTPTRRAALVLAAALLLAPAPALAAGLKVVASFSILADMAEAVGGGDTEVTALVGPDGDAHIFEPTPADAAALAEADVLLVNGLGFESWLPRLVEASGFSGRTASGMLRCTATQCSGSSGASRVAICAPQSPPCTP